MMTIVNQALQRSNINNSHDIIILGGYVALGAQKYADTVEKYNIQGGESTNLPHLNHPRGNSASCVYKGDILVTGGYDGDDVTDTIEILKMNQHPLQWVMFDVKLPVKLYDHVVVVYKDKLYAIGGYNSSEDKISDGIYELSLVPPYSVKLVIRMPQPRRYHRAEIVNGKLFIFGGTSAHFNEDAIDSVIVYDFVKNEIKQCPFLPQPVWQMSSVTSGKKIIIIGGVDKADQVLNDVITYDTETGRSENLPPMIHKRSGHCAVIINDVIVALGGWDEKRKHLNSVETFTVGGGWKELAGMKEKRAYATAVVRL